MKQKLKLVGAYLPFVKMTVEMYHSSLKIVCCLWQNRNLHCSLQHVIYHFESPPPPKTEITVFSTYEWVMNKSTNPACIM